jgi:hypothetical protein
LPHWDIETAQRSAESCGVVAAGLGELALRGAVLKVRCIRIGLGWVGVHMTDNDDVAAFTQILYEGFGARLLGNCGAGIHQRESKAQRKCRNGSANVTAPMGAAPSRSS